MVWKWPINPAALVKNQLEMAVIPNTSNIRLIRIKRGQKPANYQYWKELEELSLFHHNFWSLNNKLHFLHPSNQDDTAQFYKSFTKSRAKDFNEYHKETWRRNWNSVLTGYRCIYQSIKRKLSYKMNKNAVI